MPPAVSVRAVSKRYGAVQAVRGVDLEIQPGEFFALLGPNGAGKTTLISLLAGLARADTGQLAVLGHDVVTDYRAARRLLGVVPQELVFDPFFTARETLEIQSGYFGLRRNDAWIDELLERLHLADKAHANMRALSGGMKRRVLVAQALVHRPPVIVLDEPTAGVDVELRQVLWEFIRELNRQGHTILLTTHYLEEAEMLCERVAMLKQGQIVALDSTANLLNRFSAKRLHLVLDTDQAPAAIHSLISTQDNNRYTLTLPDYFSLQSVLSDLRSARVNILEMELAQPDLEEVFVSIMRAPAARPHA